MEDNYRGRPHPGRNAEDRDVEAARKKEKWTLARVGRSSIRGAISGDLGEAQFSINFIKGIPSSNRLIHPLVFAASICSGDVLKKDRSHHGSILMVYTVIPTCLRCIIFLSIYRWITQVARCQIINSVTIKLEKIKKKM